MKFSTPIYPTLKRFLLSLDKDLISRCQTKCVSILDCLSLLSVKKVIKMQLKYLRISMYLENTDNKGRPNLILES